MVQNAHRRLQPSEIFTYSLGAYSNSTIRDFLSVFGNKENNTSTRESSSLQGTKALTSLNSLSSSLPKREGRQPATINFVLPVEIDSSAAASRIVSILSSIAGWIKAQVFITSASYDDSISTISKPARTRSSCICAESTSFFAHPKVRNAICFGMPATNFLSVVYKLKRLTVILVL